VTTECQVNCAGCVRRICVTLMARVKTRTYQSPAGLQGRDMGHVVGLREVNTREKGTASGELVSNKSTSSSRRLMGNLLRNLPRPVIVFCAVGLED
jgi:hypothetical protein